ncbi:uncharacterized protein F4807DRAFT_179380 [Annulohypoxylon truncatum]|uniref:uncharacterized protein n=1 Tax=Annulohypoxylon truncatum TaxID=327061 RepID=UPI002008DFFE|nr:uncharacterized protein F4807DRAFT_179380 [Annulohypoxylon truncatum]KAI1207493.1 hypothetical protein F4807DRAFT_179380 [Annulohypoxylon truncatum]
MKTDFNPESDIPNLEGKVFLITGGMSPLSLSHKQIRSQHHPRNHRPRRRNPPPTRQAKARTPLLHRPEPSQRRRRRGRSENHVPPLRLRVPGLRRPGRAQSDRLDVLVASAGLMVAAPGLTGDGYEVRFGTAHMEHFTLLKLLLPVLLSTAAAEKEKKTGEGAGAGDGGDVRVVALTSLGYALHPCGGIAFEELKTEMARTEHVGALRTVLLAGWEGGRFGEGWGGYGVGEETVGVECEGD